MQGVLEIPLAIAAGDMEARVDALRTRGPDEIGGIERHRAVMQGQPVIAGTRIAVRSIKAFAADG